MTAIYIQYKSDDVCRFLDAVVYFALNGATVFRFDPVVDVLKRDAGVAPASD